MARTFTFETLSRREVADLTRDAQEPYTLLGYEDTEGQARGLVGDEVGPYVHAIARAAPDGDSAAPADIPAVSAGESQRLLTDEYGRLWVKVDTSGSSEVEIGAIAAAVPSTGLTPAVAAGDPTPVAADLNGRLIVAPQVLLTFDSPLATAAVAWRLSAVAARLWRATLVNNSATQLFVFVVDDAGNPPAPGAANIRHRSILPASGQLELDFSGEDGLSCGTGLGIYLSTTLLAATAPGNPPNAVLHATYTAGA